MPKIKLPRKIRELVKKANGGCGKAAYAIAGHYRKGTGGVEENDELARQWLVKAAELGHVGTQSDLGSMFYELSEYEAARKWWEKAAAQGDVHAMKMLGQLYEDGRGVEKNKSTAAEWYLKAA